MKKVFALLTIVSVMSFVACKNNSADEQKRKEDSIRMADSMKQAEDSMKAAQERAAAEAEAAMHDTMGGDSASMHHAQ